MLGVISMETFTPHAKEALHVVDHNNNLTWPAWCPVLPGNKVCVLQIRGNEDWWADLLQWVIYIGSDELLVERIRSELLENRQLNQTTLANRSDIELDISTWLLFFPDVTFPFQQQHNSSNLLYLFYIFIQQFP